MLQVYRRNSFYHEVEGLVMELMEDRYFVHIDNNLQIPNLLRINDTKMKFWAKKLCKQKPRGLRKGSTWNGQGEYQLHILKAPIIMSTPKNRNILLPMNSSWSLEITQFGNTMQVEGTTALVLLEFRQPGEPDERPVEDDSLLELADVVYLPTSEDFKRKWSFVRGPLSRAQIQEKLLFVDCEAAAVSRDKIRKTPLSVAIMNYYGKILMNSKITPRDRVKDFGQRFHGITEKKARNQEDEYEVVKKIQSMVKGKILVGHDLALELKCLRIPKYQLYGIRDLANAKIFRNKGIVTKNDGQWYSLKSLAKEICGLEIQEARHNALEDVKAVRDIYLKMEDEWVDDIPLIQQKVTVNKLSLQDYRKRNRGDDEELESKKRKLPCVEEAEIEPWDVSPECQIVDMDIVLQEVIVETEVESENIVINNGFVDNEINGDMQRTVIQSGAANPEDNGSNQVMEQREEIELSIVNENENRENMKDMATGTRGWDNDVDELLTEAISVCGEQYVRKKVTIEYRNTEGKSRTKIINF